MKSTLHFFVILFSIAKIIKCQSTSSNCSLGCSSCPSSSQNTQSTSCNSCDVNFQLNGSRCQYQNCPTNNYLQRYTNTQANSVNSYTDTCTSTCDISYTENTTYNVCDQLMQCPISYIRTSSSSFVGTIESIYQISSQITMIVYPTYATLIYTNSGQYLSDLVSATTLSVLYFRNYLVILSTTNQIIVWDFDSNFQTLIATINIGKITKKTQFFDLGNGQSAISSYDDSLSVVYFSRIYIGMQQPVVLDSSNPSFSFVGCALKIINGLLICLGKGSSLQIKKLGIVNNYVTLIDISQSSTCQNAIFNSNTIAQSIYFNNYNSVQQILIIQSQSTQLVQIFYDSVGNKIECSIVDLQDYPIKFRLVEQMNQQLLFSILFATKISFFDQNLSELVKISISSNSVIDIALSRDQSVSPMTTYKLIALKSVINSLQQVQTYQINVASKTSLPLSTYPILISNALSFLTYNDKNIQTDQLSTFIGNNYLFVANNNLQSVSASTDFINYIETPFVQKTNTQTSSITSMAYSDDSLYLLTCSKDGTILAWYTLTSLNPSFLYMVSRSNESCLNILIHQNKWVVALFSRSILIFQMRNNFVSYSYPFQNPATDVTQFIGQFSLNIVLYYDSNFILLNGSDLTQLGIGTYTGSQLYAIYPAQNFNIIVKSNTNLLEVYQFNMSLGYAFQKVSSLSYLSKYGDFSYIRLDWLANGDFEVLLGCKGKAFVILNSSFLEQLVNFNTYGYPINIQKFQDNNQYIFFGYSLETNQIYAFFHYAVNRQLNTGTLYTRSYSLTFNLGLFPQIDYLQNTNIGYLAIMPFSYFTLIIQGLFFPSTQSVSYGYFVYAMGSSITAFAEKDNGNVQYYGNAVGGFTFDSNSFTYQSRLSLNPNLVSGSIGSVYTSAFLEAIFVLHYQVDIHNIYTHQFYDQIQFSSSYSSELVNGFKISNLNFVAVAYKSKQLIVRNFSTKTSYTLNTMSQINGILIDEQNAKLYVYGSSLRVYNLDLTGETFITNEGSATYQQCLLTANLIICKINTSALSIISRKTYTSVSTVQIKNMVNTFVMYVDETNSQIFLATTFIQVFDFTGNVISQITSISLNILNLQLFGTNIAVMTTTYIFIFQRKTLTQIIYFKPSGGGNIKGYYYISDYNTLAYYADEIRYGQVFYFNLSTYLDDGFTIASYPELGMGSVVTMFWDKYTSRLNYLDTVGVFYSINFLSQRSFYNVVNFIDFKTLGSPTNLAVDHEYNTLFVYNSQVILQMNYNVIQKYVISQSQRTEKFYFTYLPPTSTTLTNTLYYVFDQNNILYSYINFSSIYQTYFSDPVRNVKQIDKYQLVIIIFDDVILLYTYAQVAQQQVTSSSFVGQIKNHHARRFFTDELLLTTDLKLIHINYQFYNDGTNNWQKNVIDYSSYNEYLRNFISYGPSTQEKTFISFSSGRILYYDQVTMQATVILPAWTLQNGIATNYVKYLFLTNSYLILTYQVNFVTVISLSSLSVVKNIDLSTLTASSNNVINAVFADETNGRVFINLMYSKLIYVLDLTHLTFLSYLSYPNDQYNRMASTNNYILSYSNSQVDIFKRDTLKYVNKIKKSNSSYKILSLTIIDQNKIILAMDVLLEVYLINADNSITLIDSSSISNSNIISAYLQDTDNSILRIVGISDSSVFDKRINLNVFTQVSSTSTTSSTSVQYSCYSSLNMTDRISGQNQFSYMYLNQNTNYRVLASFGQSLRSLAFITDPNVRVILQPDVTNLNSTLNLSFDSFQYIQRSIVTLTNFSLNFQDNNQNYLFSSTTTSIKWQNIQIVNQNLYNISIVFSNLNDVTINNLVISNLNYNQNKTSSDTLSKWNQTLLIFSDCTNVYINNLQITNLNLWQRSLLIGFQRVTNVYINNITVQNSTFYQFLAIEKGQNFNVNQFNILYNNIISRIPYGSAALSSYDYSQTSQELFMISIVGVTTNVLSGINMSQNTNLLLLQYINSYQSDTQQVILYNDSLTISNSMIQSTVTLNDTSISISKQINQALLNIQATNLNFVSFKYQKNTGNIQITNSKNIKILNSSFTNNESLDGGALYLDTISNNIIVTNSQFNGNSALGSGGAIYLKSVIGFMIDNKSQISNNHAEIGGGIRVVTKTVDPNLIVANQGRVTNNTADIFGKDIGTYPSRIVSSISSSSQRLLAAEKTSLNSEMEIQSFRSGDNLPLNIQLVDYYDQTIKFSISQVRDSNYALSVLEELKSYQVEMSTIDTVNTSVIGQTLLNYNQFNESSNTFEYSSLLMNAQPDSKRAFSLVITTNSFLEAASIKKDIQIDFRKCVKGEIFKSITTAIITCDICSNGFYSLLEPAQLEMDQTLACQKCPPSASSCEGDTIVLKDGYWRENQNTDSIFDCNQNTQVVSCRESQTSSRNGCIEGYNGPLCESCDESGDLWDNRYTFVEANQSCSQCNTQSVYISYFTLISIGLFIYLVLSVHMFMNQFIFHSTSSYVRYLNMLPLSSSCLNDQSTFFMKTLINYLQISSMLLQFNLKSHFTVFIHSTNYLGSPSTQVLSDSHCIYPDYFFQDFGVTQVKVFLQAVLPLLFLAGVLIFFFVCEKLKIKNIKKYHNYAALTIIFTFFQPELVTYFTQALSCRNLGGKKQVLINLLLSCSDSSYNIFSYVFIIPYLIFLLIIPLYALKILHLNRKKLFYCTTKFKLGYFYLDYKPSLYFWEFIRIYTRTFIVVFYTLYSEEDQSLAYQIVSVILCFSIIINHIYKPFLQKQVLHLETISTSVMIVNIILQQLYIIHGQSSIIILEYTIHTFFIGYILLVILRLKLNKRQQGTMIYIRNFFLKYLHKRIFSYFFIELKDLQPTLNRWIFIKKNISVITKLQAQKVQQLCDFNLSKQISGSQYMQQQNKILSKLQQNDSIQTPSSSVNYLSNRFNYNLQTSSPKMPYLRNTFSTNIIEKTISNKLIANNIEQVMKASNLIEEATPQEDNTLKSNDISLNDIDGFSQYEEQPTSSVRKNDIQINDVQVKKK